MKLNQRVWRPWVVALSLLAPIFFSTAAEGPARPPAEGGDLSAERKFPGITVPDQFSMGCVDCHVHYPEKNLDVRLSALMAGWTNAVDSPLMDRTRAIMPAGSKVKGRHPALSKATLQDIPGSCIRCHAKSSSRAPAFGAMMHAIHLGGVRDGHFLSLFQGECTHCHKLDAQSGAWRMASGPKRPGAGQEGREHACAANPHPSPERRAAGK